MAQGLYTVAPRFATIRATEGNRPKTPNNERVQRWQEGFRPGTLAERPLTIAEPLPLTPMPEKKKRRSWKRLAETLHHRKRNNQANAMELQSKTDCLDAVSLTFQSTRSEITEQEDEYTSTMPLSPLHSGWEEQSRKGRVRASNGTIQALPPIPPWVLQERSRKERSVQQADSTMDPANMVLYNFLGFRGR